MKHSRNGQSRNESIDRNPLTGSTLRAFEKKLHAKYRLKRPTWHLLDVLLARFFCGKADCYPSIRGLMEWLPDWSESTARRHLHILRDRGVIRIFEDRSIETQRRYVLVDHVHNASIVGLLTSNPNIREMTPEVHLGVSKVDAIGGVKNGAPRGVKTRAPRGVKAVTPEAYRYPLGSLEPEAELNSGTGGEIQTSNGERSGPLAPLAQNPPPEPATSEAPVILPLPATAQEPDQADEMTPFERATRDQAAKGDPIAQRELERIIRGKAIKAAEASGKATTDGQILAQVLGKGITGPAAARGYLAALRPRAHPQLLTLAKAALCATFRLTDAQDYSRSYAKIIREVDEGKRSAAEVVYAFDRATDPSAKYPGRVFAHHIERRTGRATE